MVWGMKKRLGVVTSSLLLYLCVGLLFPTFTCNSGEEHSHTTNWMAHEIEKATGALAGDGHQHSCLSHTLEEQLNDKRQVYSLYRQDHEPTVPLPQEGCDSPTVFLQPEDTRLTPPQAIAVLTLFQAQMALFRDPFAPKHITAQAELDCAALPTSTHRRITILIV